MPNKDRVEACREIMEFASATRVVMLTASTEEDAVIEAVAAGAAGYLQKVSGMERLLATVRDVAAGGPGDSRAVLPGPFLRPDSGGPWGQAGDHSQRHLQHSGQAGLWLQAGGRGLGGAERTAG